MVKIIAYFCDSNEVLRSTKNSRTLGKEKTLAELYKYANKKFQEKIAQVLERKNARHQTSRTLYSDSKIRERWHGEGWGLPWNTRIKMNSKRVVIPQTQINNHTIKWWWAKKWTHITNSHALYRSYDFTTIDIRWVYEHHSKELGISGLWLNIINPERELAVIGWAHVCLLLLFHLLPPQ